MRRWPLTLFRSLCGALLVLQTAGFAAVYAQQVGAAVSANLDEIHDSGRRRLLERPDQSTVTPAPEDFDKVKLTPGSLLQMDVYGIPEYTGVLLRVNAQGQVSVPNLGPVSVTGLTLLEAQEVIARSFVTDQILVHPTVRLNMLQFSADYVSVLGEVQTPGRYQLIAGRSLSDVLALAGGETLAAGDDIELQRGGENSGKPAEHIHFAQRDSVTSLNSIRVNPGDSIYVRRAGVVYVLGAVNKPGGYLMVDSGGLDILQALSLAGGATLDAASNGLYIIRPHGGSYEQIKVPFKQIAHASETEIRLQVNDVLYMPRSGWKVTLLDGSAIIGAAVSGAVYSAR